MTGCCSCSSYTFGTYIVLEHDIGGDSFYSLYGHLNATSVSVSLGVHVRKGQVLGRVGNTGCSTGPHLHFQVSDSVSLDVSHHVIVDNMVGIDSIANCTTCGHAVGPEFAPEGLRLPFAGLARFRADGYRSMARTISSEVGEPWNVVEVRAPYWGTIDAVGTCRPGMEGTCLRLRHEASGSAYFSHYGGLATVHVSQIGKAVQPGALIATADNQSFEFEISKDRGPSGSDEDDLRVDIDNLSRDDTNPPTRGVILVGCIQKCGGTLSGGQAFGPAIRTYPGDVFQAQIRRVARDPNAKHLTPDRYAEPG